MSEIWTRHRWGDNDRYLGPFTYASPSKQGYRSLSIILASGDGDERPGCSLRLSAAGHTLIISLPAVIRPERKKVVPAWDAATIKRLGRDYYWDYTPREYGFSYGEGFLNICHGRQTHDSSTEQRWGYFTPWTQWRFVRHSVYGLDGALHAHLPASARWGSPDYETGRSLEESCPKATFTFKDFDGEQLTAETKIEEREWLKGKDWCAWLSWFAKPKIRRSCAISFSNETGRRKGSWKGGTMGTGIDLLPGELHESAFRRYCAANEMEFV